MATLAALLGMKTVSVLHAAPCRRPPESQERKKERITSEISAPDAGCEGVFGSASAEYAALATLVDLLLPTEANSPGAVEARVAQKINASLATDPSKRDLYSVGLASFEHLAQSRWKTSFIGLSQSLQIELISFVDEAANAVYAEANTFMSKIRRKLQYWYYVKWLELSPLIAFWRQLQDDAMVQFYADSIAWAWLGYEGPPFPLGYLNRPAQPRA